LPGLAIATGAISLFVFIFLRIKLDELPDMVEGRHCRRLYLLIPLIVLAPLLLATLGLGSTTSRPEEASVAGARPRALPPAVAAAQFPLSVSHAACAWTRSASSLASNFSSATRQLRGCPLWARTTMARRWW
jgi:hypothetical protein